MTTNSLRTFIETLESLFSKFNEKFFENKLSKPVITVSPDTTTKGAYAWCTSWKAWKNGETEGYYEINMCAEHISRPFEDTCDTLLHEMVHLYNLEIGIKDTSRSGTYHNKRFKIAAEGHGLLCECSEKYGWSNTNPTPETLEYFNSLNNNGFSLYRVRQPKGRGKSKQSTKKYVCSKCKNIVRATKEIRIICQDCDVLFKVAE